MNAFEKARFDCIQDSMENSPFASVGGLDKRKAMIAPDYIVESDREEYIKGYRVQALAQYGVDWEICQFGWVPTFVINPSDPPKEKP